MKQTYQLVFLTSLWLFAYPLPAQVVLYNGTLGTTPATQGWQYLANPIAGNTVTQSLGAGYVTLDTTSPITDQAGYFSANPVFPILAHPNMPLLDRLMGFDIRFDIRVDSENHVAPPSGDDNGDGLADRAGFSVIAISDDLEGIELGFWSDRIWAQEDDQIVPGDFFTQAEGVALDTTSALLRYDLRIHGSRYQLVRGGGVAPVLSGRLRNYTSFSGTVDPYEVPSFLFFGDDTTRAEAAFDLARIEVRDLPSPADEADALVAEIVAGTNSEFYDLTGDGLVDQGDLAAWLVAAGEFNLGVGRAFLPGDANLDGTVDGQDFIIWNDNKFTATAAWTAGDFNADGVSDGQDFIVWNDFKFQSSLVFVPEPARTPPWWASWAIAAIGARTCRRSWRDSCQATEQSTRPYLETVATSRHHRGMLGEFYRDAAIDGAAPAATNRGRRS